MAEPAAFDVFLSYNSKDKAAVIRLAEKLQAQGLRVWLDVWELRPGHPWQEALEATIETIQAAAVLVGQDGIGPWQSREMRGCLSEFVERGQPVIPVLLEDCPAVPPKLPFFLKQFTWVDLRDGQHEDGFHRLVWGITGQKPPPFAAKPAPPDPAPAPAPAPDQPLPILRHRLRDGSPGPEMVLIPAGEFRMGDLDGSGSDSEKPVHLVRIARPFYLGRYAVTFDEYDKFAQARGPQPPDDRGWGRGNRPVINVSWQDAVDYCQWLAEQTGQPYRLPSEAEWEYAARAGTQTAYWWGAEAGQNHANFNGSGSQWSGKQTAPVGSFPPNPWGLFDTAGNVWEWVRDRWHDDYRNAPEDGSAWESGRDHCRVLRGGSWFGFGRYVRSAYRYRCEPGFRYDYFGFRLALGPSGPA